MKFLCITINGNVVNTFADVVAANVAALWSGSFSFTAKYDESGNQVAQDAWTGSIYTGVKEVGMTCNNWADSSNSYNGNHGWVGNTTSKWFNSELWSQTYCSGTKRLYCISQ